MKPFPHDLISRDDLLDRWRCSLSTLKRMEKKGKLKPVRIGPRLLRYRAEEIEQIEAAG